MASCTWSQYIGHDDRLGPLLRVEEVGSWTRTMNEWIGPAFLNSTGTGALLQDL